MVATMATSQNPKKQNPGESCLQADEI